MQALAPVSDSTIHAVTALQTLEQIQVSDFQQDAYQATVSTVFAFAVLQSPLHPAMCCLHGSHVQIRTCGVVCGVVHQLLGDQH